MFVSWMECQQEEIAQRSVYLNNTNHPKILDYPSIDYGLVIVPSWWSLCKPDDLNFLSWLGFSTPEIPSQEEIDLDRQLNNNR